MQPRHALSTNAHTTQDHSTLHKTPGALRSDLHVLIPASRPDPNLCKAILSGNVLGYPRPTIINWNQTFDDPAFVEGGSHLAKINGTAQYLYSLDVSRDEDLVLMIDGYDAWLQLRPQTLHPVRSKHPARASHKAKQLLRHALLQNPRNMSPNSTALWKELVAQKDSEGRLIETRTSWAFLIESGVSQYSNRDPIS